MASVVQVGQNVGIGSNLTVTMPGSTTGGNALVGLVFTAGSTNGTVTGITLGGSAGNWAAEASQGSGSDHALLTCWSDPSCAGGQTSVVITTNGPGGQTALAWVFEVSGLLAAGPLLDKSAGVSSSGFVASWTLGPTATTTQASEIWLAIAGGSVSGTTAGTLTGPSSPWTNQAQQSQVNGSFTQGVISGYQVVSSTGTASYNGSSSPNSTIEGLVVTLKALAPPVPVPARQRSGPARARFWSPR
jgi:hypothetical protein